MSQKLNAVPMSFQTARQRLFANQSSKSVLDKTHTEELVIAMCGPIGTPLPDVSLKIGEVLTTVFGYAFRVDSGSTRS